MFAVALLVLTAATDEPEPAIQVTVKAKDGGNLRAGAPAQIEVSARDPATGFALSGLTPAFWLVPEDTDTANGGCDRLVNRLAASAVTPEGTVNLNGFDVVQATSDGRIALVDPLLNLASANIKAIVDVGAIPAGWSLNASGHTLAVATVADRTLRLIDMSDFAVKHSVRLEAEPAAVIQSGAGYWVGGKDGWLVTVNDRGTLGAKMMLGIGPVAFVTTGGGIVALARSGDGAFLRDSGSQVPFKLGAAVAGMAYAPLADSLYALADGGDALFVVRQDRPDAAVRLPLDRSARTLAADPQGRWLALVAADGLAVTIFDIARGRPRWTVAVQDPVIAADFSDSFLYLVHARQGGATRIVFDPEGGPPGVVTIAAGSSRDSEQRAGALPIMARIPQAGMLIASSRDRSAYMVNDDNAQAAMSSLPLRAGEPAGIILRYRGLAQGAERGDYRAEAVVPRGGRYVAVVRTEQPGIAHCARVAFASAPGEQVAPVLAKAGLPIARRLVTAAQIAPGRQVIRFSISGSPSARLRGATLVGDGWQLTPTDISTAPADYAMAVDLQPSRAFTLFVQYQDAAGMGILSTPVQVLAQ